MPSFCSSTCASTTTCVSEIIPLVYAVNAPAGGKNEDPLYHNRRLGTGGFWFRAMKREPGPGVAAVAVAFLADPRATRIELTERSEPAASAHNYFPVSEVR
jgi:hypothetical protein